MMSSLRGILRAVTVGAFLSMAVGASALNLPNTPVGATYAHPGTTSFFDIVLFGTGAGFDVTDGFAYTGWCIEDNLNANTSPVRLYSSYDPALPGNLGSVPWDRLNYILNHKQGTAEDVQAALWSLTLGSFSYPVTPAAVAMLNDAAVNGIGFVPGPGQIIAVILYTGDDGIRWVGFQDTIIELRLPSLGGQGCTPGFWRNHFWQWPAAYSPSDDYETVFGVDASFTATLGQAVQFGGGGELALARHAVSALLNAASDGVSYGLTPGQVIDTVRQAYATGSFESAKNLLEAENELGCPLRGGPAPDSSSPAPKPEPPGKADPPGKAKKK